MNFDDFVIFAFTHLPMFFVKILVLWMCFQGPGTDFGGPRTPKIKNIGKCVDVRNANFDDF